MSEEEINGVTLTRNVEANRLQLFFPGKPSDNWVGCFKQTNNF